MCRSVALQHHDHNSSSPLINVNSWPKACVLCPSRLYCSCGRVRPRGVGGLNGVQNRLRLRNDAADARLALQPPVPPGLALQYGPEVSI